MADKKISALEEDRNSFSAQPRDEGDKFTKDDPSKDISSGPIKERGCTDWICLIVFALAWIAFILVSYAGGKNGEPAKLYKPRDYRGSYCGIPSSKQWGGSPNFKDYAFLVSTMNVSGVVNDMAQQLVCSTAAEEALQGLLTATQMATYMCSCCKSPCKSCFKVASYSDFTSPAALQDSFESRMDDLTDPSRALSLFSPNGANGGAFNDIWSDYDKYFIPVCVKSCASPTTNSSASRSYTYSPTPDIPWKQAWDALANDVRPEFEAIQNTIGDSFTFDALSQAECPYDDTRYCVPFPGLTYGKAYGGWCNFQIASDVAAAMGGGIADMGLAQVAQRSTANFGTAMGDAMQTLDVLAVCGAIALIYGFVFMVLLRFFIKPAVWGSLLLVFVMLIAGGATAYVESGKCEGDSMVQSGTTYAAAANQYAQSVVKRSNHTYNATLEILTGDGQDYRGLQNRTRSLRTCQRWDAYSPHNHTENNITWPSADLRENYCRNPGGSAKYIWCYTTDPTVRWEMCDPLGTTALDRKCPNGYAIKDERMRYGVEVCAWCMFILAAIWLFLCFCLINRIRLAIAINEVAAMFVYNTPIILMVPVCQTIVALLWTMFWFFCATFLLSQVPDGAVPKSAYTYVEAFGNSSTPGKCTGSWPTGDVWRYTGNLTATDDPCTGNLGDISLITPRCWKCSPPRYAFDVRFAFSFFMFLWNSNFLIAVGECIIAGACAAWFFLPTEDRSRIIGLGRAQVKTSVYNVFRYHLGSLALGSFIIAAVQFARYMLMYMEKQFQQQKNKVMQYLMKALVCCLWCLEKFLKFINKNAYIQIAILGKNFCYSAKAAFQLILRNAVRIATLGALGNIVRFIGMVFIMVATSFTGFFILRGMEPKVSPLVPMLMIIAFAYMVGASFLNVFGLAVDTMLQCFIAAEEMHLPDKVIPEKLRDLRSVELTGGCCKTCLCCFGGGGHDHVPPPAPPAGQTSAVKKEATAKE